MTYAEWIALNVPGYPVGLCNEISASMAEEFPELTRVRGHYIGAGLDSPRPHWWLVDAHGTIVDPTAAQFPDRGRGLYDPHDETTQEPTGKCSNCGEYCYEGRSPCCSETCDRDYRNYIMGQRA